MRGGYMFKGRCLQFLTLALSTAIVGVFTIPAIAADVPRITKEELKSMLGNPDVVILDVRGAKQWKASKKKIKGAVWEDPGDTESWTDKYPKDKTLVLY
jgi:hypothetical protein